MGSLKTTIACPKRQTSVLNAKSTFLGCFPTKLHKIWGANYGLDFQKETDEFLFRIVLKISKIQFTQFLHTSASKFLLKTLPVYWLLQPKPDFLSFIVPVRSKILVLSGWDLGAGNLKF